MPKPISSVRLLENAANKTPAPSPSMAPKLICLTAAGFSVLPSFVSGVLGPRESADAVVLNGADCDAGDAGEYGDVSRRVMGRGWRKGIERERPNATSTGRLRGDCVRETGMDLDIAGRRRDGRRADLRSMMEGRAGTEIGL